MYRLTNRRQPGLVVQCAFALVASLLFAHTASAALYTNSYGTLLPNSSNCDDCFDGPISLGAGHSINFFGTTYTDVYVGSNGYITFGSGSTGFIPSPLDVQTLNPMIAGLFTDLDSRSDAASEVYVNTSTPGELIVTWIMLGHFPTNYSVRNTFQVVLRSDTFLVPGGEGQIGFHYGDISDTTVASGGFGDGLSDVNPGELALFSQVPANTQSNASSNWYSLNGGTPQDVDDVPAAPVPVMGVGGLMMMILVLPLVAWRSRRRLGL